MDLTAIPLPDLIAEVVRRERLAKTSLIKIITIEDKVALFSNIKNKPHEEFWIATLDGQNRLINKYQIGIGTVNQVHVWPRLIFEKVLQDHAPKFIAAHNHPSGEIEITKADLCITKTLDKTGVTLNSELIDHLIVSAEGYRSIKYNTIFPTEVN